MTASTPNDDAARAPASHSTTRAKHRPRGRSHAPSVRLDGHALPERLTRLRGGTYSPTVGRARFADGESALVDLIRLTPDVDAYSLEPHGISPTHAAHYRPRAWSSAPSAGIRGVERQIIWILTRSYPTVDVATLSAALRAKGHEIGRGDLPEHEAIAATQAAIWHFTDGRRLLEETEANPVRLTARGRNGSLTADPLSLAGRSWRAMPSPGSPALLDVRITEHPAIDAYAFDLAERPDDSLAFALQCSLDGGGTWREIPSSAVVPARQGRMRDGRFHVVKGLGAGATIAHSVAGRSLGYPEYRVVARSTRAGAFELSALRFRPVGQSGDANSARVVELYRYLVAGAKRYADAEDRSRREAVDADHGLHYSGTVLLGTDPESSAPLTTLGLVTASRARRTASRPPGGALVAA
ncbi:thioester domain-containing protein [Leucobacter weissii]|uniref:Thioester domain-containing protein n=1 Tax=Leucobacter weissii TaxID=1983706 RepID=A0A939MH02_9MICO|nr:thioester domain-containing protein [Leucobacter weissii]MBO1900738.1 thioester domain-containing protein [Leucobacter weissii]